MHLPSRKHLRIAARVLLLILSAHVALFATVFLFHFFLVKKLMSDDDIRLVYANHKDQFERLKSMCLEDKGKTSLPFFALSAKTRETNCFEIVGSIDRCQEYARLFASLNVGRISWEEQSVWIYLDGWGWAGKGIRKGLMWQEAPVLRQNKNNRQHYMHIEDGWYIYQINPSESLFGAETK